MVLRWPPQRSSNSFLISQSRHCMGIDLFTFWILAMMISSAMIIRLSYFPIRSTIFFTSFFFLLLFDRSQEREREEKKNSAPSFKVIVSIYLSTTNKLPFIRVLTLCRMHEEKERRNNKKKTENMKSYYTVCTMYLQH